MDDSEQRFMYRYETHCHTSPVSYCARASVAETVQFYSKDGSPESYYKKSWSLIFDSMIMHVAVDAGYAETLTIICNLAGIECFTVKSDSHIWNIARIDGNYYHFDACFDRGLTPADFRCFGVSDRTLQTVHGTNEELFPVYRECYPSCTDDLYPVSLDPGTDESAPIYRLVTFYRFRNDRNANPLFLFYLLHYSYEEIGKEALKNNRIRTRVKWKELTDLLSSVMTEKQLAQFTAGYFETEDGGKLSYRIPPENPVLTRLVGLEEIEDGIWLAHVLRFHAPFDFSMDEETISMSRINGEWLVDGVE